MTAAFLPASAAPASPAGLVRKHTRAGTALAVHALAGLDDLGSGWSATSSPTGETSLTCAGFEPPLPGVVETGAASSDSFQRSATGPFVTASSWAYRSAAEATTVWQRVVGRGLLDCFVRSVKQGATSGVRFTVRSAAPAPFPSLAPRTAAYRVVAAARRSGQTVSAYYTLIVLDRDRLIAELTLAQLETPIPRATELSLARRIAHRLAGARPSG
jgi:hypothetical protein